MQLEILTLSEAKSYLGVSHDLDDDLISSHIKTAIRVIESVLGSPILIRKVHQPFKMDNGLGEVRIPLPTMIFNLEGLDDLSSNDIPDNYAPRLTPVHQSGTYNDHIHYTYLAKDSNENLITKTVNYLDDDNEKQWIFTKSSAGGYILQPKDGCFATDAVNYRAILACWCGLTDYRKTATSAQLIDEPEYIHQFKEAVRIWIDMLYFKKRDGAGRMMQIKDMIDPFVLWGT